jgi:hypothetical protein
MDRILVLDCIRKLHVILQKVSSDQRDRQGGFEPLVVKKHQSNVTGIEDQIIALYAKMSARVRFRITCRTGEALEGFSYR